MACALFLVAAARSAGGVVEGVWCNGADVAIPDADATGITSTIAISTGVPSAQVNVLSVYVVVDHGYASDLEIQVVSPAMTTRTLVDRPGLPCPENDLAALFNDFGYPAANTQCDATPSAVHGTVTPLQAFYLVTPLLLDGGWELRVSDNASGDLGTLRFWCVISGAFFYDGFESGDVTQWSSHQP